MYDSQLNETFYDLQSKDNDTNWFGKYQRAIPIWIRNQLRAGRQSGVVGRFPGANVPILNRTVSRSADYANAMSWRGRVDLLVSWLAEPSSRRINLGVLYFSESDETGHGYGPSSSPALRRVLRKCDRTLGYLIERLKAVELFDRAHIMVTSDHGMDHASREHSIDLSDYMDTQKYRAFGGLTQLNIFPNEPSDEQEIYDALRRVPNYKVFRRAQVPLRLHYSRNIRIGPLVMYGNTGYEIFEANRSKFDWSKWSELCFCFRALFCYINDGEQKVGLICIVFHSQFNADESLPNLNILKKRLTIYGFY